MGTCNKGTVKVLFDSNQWCGSSKGEEVNLCVAEGSTYGCAPLSLYTAALQLGV